MRGRTRVESDVMSKRKIKIEDAAEQDPTAPCGDDQPDNTQAPRDDEIEQDAESTESTTDPQTDLETEMAQLNERLLRVSADYQNYVRRSQQNVTDARDQQLMQVARALVTVLDHFDRALEVDLETASAESVLDGMKIVRNELLATLDRFGVQRLEVHPGDAFDPTRHEALMRQPAEGIESSHVVAQLQPGYMLGDKTLRAAQVSVAE